MNRDNENVLSSSESNFQSLLSDANNIFMIDEYVIGNGNECKTFQSLFELEIPVQIISQGCYTCKLNCRYLIINDSFQKEIKDLIRFLFSLKQEKISMVESQLCSLTQINHLCNLILIFSPEMYTLYHIKLSILSQDKEDRIGIMLSELKFINLLSKYNRKCSISWHYRYILITTYHSQIKLILAESEDSLTCDKKFIQNMISIFQIEERDIKNEIDIVLVYDLLMLATLNEKEKRNYHLWKYLLKLFQWYNHHMDKFLIISCALMSFFNDVHDYSAYSFLVNIFTGKIDYNFLEQLSGVKKALSQYMLELDRVYNYSKLSTYYDSFHKIVAKA